MDKCICNICGQVVNIRRRKGAEIYPVAHTNPKTNDFCHGFYGHGGELKDEKDS